MVFVVRYIFNKGFDGFYKTRHCFILNIITTIIMNEVISFFSFIM
jgi:hypothetical protein